MSATYNRAVCCSASSSDLNSDANEQPRRLLGLDVGHKRIGMAVSDLLNITAQGIDTLQRRNKRTDFQQLARVIRNYNIAEIVVGLPLRLSGTDSAQTEKVTTFADELRTRFSLPVHLWDERLTSVQANRLMREADVSIEKRAASVDRMAAMLILQSFMDARSLSKQSDL